MPETIDHDLAVIADDIEGRLDDLVDAILASVAVLPGYSTGRRPGDTEDIRAGFRHSTHLFLSCLRHDRTPTEQELARIREIGRQRARQGLPRPSVSRSLDRTERIAFLKRVLGPVLLDARRTPAVIEGRELDVLHLLSGEATLRLRAPRRPRRVLRQHVGLGRGHSLGRRHDGQGPS